MSGRWCAGIHSDALPFAKIPGVALFKQAEPPPGFRTGTLTVEPDHLPTRISVLTYGPHSADEKVAATIEDLRSIVGDEANHWIHVQGFGQPDLIESIAAAFELDQALVEDISERRQRPKTEWIGEQTVAVLRAPYESSISTSSLEQVSILVAGNFVLTIQETHSGTAPAGLGSRPGRVWRVAKRRRAAAVLSACRLHHRQLLSRARKDRRSSRGTGVPRDGGL